MNVPSIKIKKEYKTLDSYSTSKNVEYFTPNEITSFFFWGFPLDIKGSKKDNIIFILDSKYDSYETYLGKEDFNIKKNIALQKVDKFITIIKKRKGYERLFGVIDYKSFIKIENNILDLMFMYRFCSFYFSDETTDEIHKNYKRFSLKSLHNHKKWKGMFSHHLFFDSEHFSFKFLKEKGKFI